MSNTERYRPPRESYQPPTLPLKPTGHIDIMSKTPTWRRDRPSGVSPAVPPAVPTPPTHSSSRTSPPRPTSHRSAPSTSSPEPLTRTQTSQWFFTPDEVVSTPSIVDGLPPGEERLRRAKGVNFIIQAGVILELPQITLWVASVFFHRFYMRYSMFEEKGGLHHYNIAATSLFLANKTEENCRKTRDLIIAVAKVAQKNTKLIIDEQSKEYWRWRDSILHHEEVMLEQLTFDLMVDNPYQQLYEQLSLLGLVHNKRLREAAWTFCNDACLTTLPLLMDARDVSISAIFFATSMLKERIADVNGEPWWGHLKGSESNMGRAVGVMIDFYNENPLKKQDVRPGGSPIFRLDNTRRRGDTMFSQNTDLGSSHNGSPLGTDYYRGTQSPVGGGTTSGGNADDELTTSNDKNEGDFKREDDDEDADTGDEMAHAEAAHNGPGDSDAMLKAAAKDLDVHHGHANGGHLVSPGGGKRKELDFDSEADLGRETKRTRTSIVGEAEMPRVGA